MSNTISPLFITPRIHFDNFNSIIPDVICISIDNTKTIHDLQLCIVEYVDKHFTGCNLILEAFYLSLGSFTPTIFERLCDLNITQSTTIFVRKNELIIRPQSLSRINFNIIHLNRSPVYIFCTGTMDRNHEYCIQPCCNDELQLNNSYRCNGKYDFQSQRLTLFSTEENEISLFNYNSRIPLHKSITIKELKIAISNSITIQNNQILQILGISDISNYNTFYIDFDPTNYILAIDESNLSYSVCKISPITPKLFRENLIINVQNQNGNLQNIDVGCNPKLSDIKSRISTVYGKDITLVSGAPLTDWDNIQIQSCNFNKIMVNINTTIECNATLHENSIIPMIDIIATSPELISPILQQPFTVPFKFKASCGCELSYTEYHQYLKTINVENLLCINEDKNSNDKYLILCPTCKNGGFTLHSARINFYKYNKIKHQSNICDKIARGGIECNLSTHRTYDRYFIPNSLEEKVLCPQCKRYICKVHGNDYNRCRRCKRNTIQ